MLSNSISQHLRNFIEQIDISIVKKIKQILEKMIKQKGDTDPMQRVKVTLIDANQERIRTNNENIKRKRNNDEEYKGDDRPNKNKKFKKNNKDKS